MTAFGLDEQTVDSLMSRLGPEDGTLESHERSEGFARAAWSGIAEPGDGTAGAVIGAIGAATALTALIEGWGRSRVVDAVRAAAPELAEIVAAEFAAATARWRPRLTSASVISNCEHALAVGARLMVPSSVGWPSGLDDLGRHAPGALWLRGSSAACERTAHSCALVGARAATGYGEHVTMEASAGLVERGFAIVSGAAYGIDGMAHRAALAAEGTTLAFLAGGVDRYYPSGHAELLGRISRDGAVLSEVPCGFPPTKWRFLQRNRLIAASSRATVVVEAGRRSGSLNTAGHAAAIGRPLGAVPGPVTSPTSSGCHRLIRDYDAICVTTAVEMAELVDGIDDSVELLNTADNGERTRVLDALSARSPRLVADIAARSGLSIAVVASILGGLGLENVAAEREHGWVRT